MDGSPHHPNDLWIIAEPKTPGCQGRNQKELPEKFHGVPSPYVQTQLVEVFREFVSLLAQVHDDFPSSYMSRLSFLNVANWTEAFE